MGFPERLRELRRIKGFTQKQVREGTGISDMGYRRYEYGMRDPAYKQLLALADFFNVSLDYLVGRSDNPQRL